MITTQSIYNFRSTAKTSRHEEKNTMTTAHILLPVMMSHVLRTSG